MQSLYIGDNKCFFVYINRTMSRTHFVHCEEGLQGRNVLRSLHVLNNICTVSVLLEVTKGHVCSIKTTCIRDLGTEFPAVSFPGMHSFTSVG